MGAELYAYRRTDITKLEVTFRNSSNAPKIWSEVPYRHIYFLHLIAVGRC